MKQLFRQMMKVKAASFTKLQKDVPKLTTFEKRCLNLQVYIHRCLNYRLDDFGFPQCDTFAKANNSCFVNNLITKKTYERCKIINAEGNITKHANAVKKLVEQDEVCDK